jgi:ribosomal protein S18 acetylase RimI-like enzyme
VAEDAPAIARVQVASWRETYAGIVPQDHLDGLDAEERTPRWSERLAAPGIVALVAEDESGVLAFAAGCEAIHPVDGYDGELVGLYVLASYHRRGVGRALVRAFAERMARDGFRSLVVWALRENPACGFYRRLGGVEVGETTIEVGGAWLPEVAFGWKEIGALLRDAALP